MTVIPEVREELVEVVAIRMLATAAGQVKSSQVKSSQVVGLRTRTASFPTLMFSSPRVVGYDGDPGG